ncbi:hypothetical protein, partial [Vibrio kanaloae]|uniref:hypothetical protein n=1 Tax=Vibrio kanaloae TaxID=170673 RepID=UPI0019CF97AF
YYLFYGKITIFILDFYQISIMIISISLRSKPSFSGGYEIAIWLEKNKYGKARFYNIDDTKQ